MISDETTQPRQHDEWTITPKPEPPDPSSPSSSLTKSQTATAVRITAHNTSTVVRAVVTLITWRLPTPTIKSEGDTNSAEDSGSVASLAGDLGLVALSSTKSITRGASA